MPIGASHFAGVPIGFGAAADLRLTLLARSPIVCAHQVFPVTCWSLFKGGERWTRTHFSRLIVSHPCPKHDRMTLGSKGLGALVKGQASNRCVFSEPGGAVVGCSERLLADCVVLSAFSPTMSDGLSL